MTLRCKIQKGLHICNEVSNWWLNILDASDRDLVSSARFDGKISDIILKCCISMVCS